MAEALAGYWPSPWPAEDGGPSRLQTPRDGDHRGTTGFDLTAGRLAATSRDLFASTMTVLRDPGEVFVLAHTVGPGCVAWVERIHPETLEPLARSVDLEAGPFWPGGMAVHADGSLYVTFGRFCHRLDPTDLRVLARHQLPRDRPYNSLVVLGSGHLVMKDIAGGVGLHQLGPDRTGSELVVLAPGTLDEVARLELPEGSVARLSARGQDVYAVGERQVHRVRVDPDSATLTVDDRWAPTYRRLDGQTFGWDMVLADGSGWFLDNGEGSEEFGGCFRGKGRSRTPLHLVRVGLGEEAGQAGQGATHQGDRPDEVELVEVCGEPGGVIANPPAVDPDRHLVVGYDSGHGQMAAWRYHPGRAGLDLVWRRQQDHAGHMLRLGSGGQLLTYDYDLERGMDQAVVLDIETGQELGRTDTGSPLQCVLFPCAGWDGDVYVSTFTTLTRLHLA
jgi:hypothetical protein